MKSRIILSVILILSTIFSAYSNSPTIIRVVVYRQGAKITQTLQVSVSQGSSEVVIGDLTQYIDPNSLQVSTRGSAILLSASVRTNFMGYKTLPMRTRELEDSLEWVTDRIDWLGNEQSVYAGEEKLIIDNQKIVNEKEKITANDISMLADFYRNRLTAIRKKTYENNITLRKLKDRKKQIEQQLQEINYQKGRRMGEIVLNFSAEQATRVAITFSYLTNNAGWSPLYDIRCSGTAKPLDLLYKANVNQTTGYDWSDVDLVISTGNPTANNERPIMNPWYIDFLQPAIPGYGQYKKEAAPAASTRNMMMVADETEAMPEQTAPAVPYQVVETSNQMSVEYEIKIKQNIPADGKEHIVPITTYELPASYTYHTVPKLDQHAFLLAKVTDYNQFNLLPGTTNIFFEGMYVGQTYLNPEVTSDTLLLSLGRDDRISIKRDMLKDFTSSKIVGTNKKVVKGYETIIRNNKNIPVSLEVLDQVPLSQNKDIVVEVDEMSGAQYVEDYGKLLWKLNLAPGEIKKIRLIYSVKFPKDKQVAGI